MSAPTIQEMETNNLSVSAVLAEAKRDVIEHSGDTLETFRSRHNDEAFFIFGQTNDEDLKFMLRSFGSAEAVAIFAFGAQLGYRLGVRTERERER